ncbi:hypothetical protein N9L62_01930 [Candidatus Actinomarina sp.]|nr:hypothetical protein [Candidatus Actinomarina sp.]
MIHITKWQGGFGNNLIQLINAIKIAETEKINVIKFPFHDLFTVDNIKLEFTNSVNKNFNELFFKIEEHIAPIEMKRIFHQYIESIFKINTTSNSHIYDDNQLTVHLRSGDIFNKNPHSSYIQPPLSYYLKLLEKYDLNLVFQDYNNPCISSLLINEGVKNASQSSLHNDLVYLANSKNLAIGHGTFGLAIYIISNKLQNLYIPHFSFLDFPSGEWGSDINIHTIELKNYIKKGNWKNSYLQRRKMLNYKLKEDFILINFN